MLVMRIQSPNPSRSRLRSTTSSEASKFSTGGALTFLGKAAGFEFEFGYTPDFFNQQTDFALIADSNVTTFMGNVLVNLGATARVKPYGIFGLGLLRSRIDATDLFDATTANDFGVNVGGGVICMFADNVGVRGDIRYFRSLQDPSNDNDTDVTLGKFDFWRGAVSFTFKF
jgi:opacity protein-like surface antigen